MPGKRIWGENIVGNPGSGSDDAMNWLSSLTCWGVMQSQAQHAAVTEDAFTLLLLEKVFLPWRFS